MRNRVIPVLLLKNGGLVKTKKFNNSKYIGDPINAIKIFNQKEVDEMIFLDICASKNMKHISVFHVCAPGVLPLPPYGPSTTLPKRIPL